MVRAALQIEILRTDRPDGTGYAVEGVSVPLSPVWRLHLQRLVSRIGYDGPGCLQYICDTATQRSTLLELNPRIGANHAAAEALGLKLPYWWIEYLETGRARIPEPFEYVVGVRYAWLTGDLADGSRRSATPMCRRGSARWQPFRCSAR